MTTRAKYRLELKHCPELLPIEELCSFGSLSANRHSGVTPLEVLLRSVGQLIRFPNMVYSTKLLVGFSQGSKDVRAVDCGEGSVLACGY